MWPWGFGIEFNMYAISLEFDSEFGIKIELS